MYKRWTQDEDDILTLVYPSEAAEVVLARLPGRTKIAIRGRAIKLKLKRAPGLESITHGTKTCACGAPKGARSTVCQACWRNRGIQCMKHRKARYFTRWEDAILIELGNRLTFSEIRGLIGTHRSNAAIKHRAKELRIKLNE